MKNLYLLSTFKITLVVSILGSAYDYQDFLGQGT